MNADEHTLSSTRWFPPTPRRCITARRDSSFSFNRVLALKVVTDLIGPQDKPQLLYSTQEKQLDLLAKVLSAGEAEAGEEVLPEDEDADSTGSQ